MSVALRNCLLSVAAWPSTLAGDANLDLRLRAILAATGVEAPDARQAALRPCPCILAALTEAEAEAGAASLRELRVPAFALRSEEIAKASDALRLKRLIPALGAPEPLYQAEPWKGEPEGLRMADVLLVVYGRIRRSTRTVEHPSGNRNAVRGMMIGGVEGAIVGGMMDAAESSTSTTTDAHYELIDIYRRTGPPLRIDSSRFQFNLEGMPKLEGKSAMVRELLARMGGELSGNRVDRGFENFRAPRGATVLVRSWGTGSIQKRDDTPEFDLYSPWIFLLRMSIAAYRRAGA